MTKVFFSRITAVGSYLPAKKLSNKDLEKFLDTSDEWIETRTGISSRRIARDDEATSDMAVSAFEEMLKNYDFNPNTIDGIIVATTTPDLTFPATAAIIQQKLELSLSFCFDLQAACSGFVYAVSVADSMIKNNLAKNILVVGADKMSSVIDWQDRNTAILFGDGAGCVLVSKSDKPGIIASDLKNEGSLVDILKTTGGVSSNQTTGFATMKGKEVFKHASAKMAESVNKLLANEDLTPNDIDLVIPHQANSRILDMVGKILDIPKEKIIYTVKHQANTTAATIPLAMDSAIKDGRIKPGQKIVLTALGAGISWGSILLNF